MACELLETDGCAHAVPSCVSPFARMQALQATAPAMREKQDERYTGQRANFFTLVRFDFMLDENKDVYLIEVRCLGLCFAKTLERALQVCTVLQVCAAHGGHVQHVVVHTNTQGPAWYWPNTDWVGPLASGDASALHHVCHDAGPSRPTWWL